MRPILSRVTQYLVSVLIAFAALLVIWQILRWLGRVLLRWLGPMEL